MCHFWDAEVSGEGVTRVERPPGPGQPTASAFTLIQPGQTEVVETALSSLHPRWKWRIDGRVGDYKIRLIYGITANDLATMNLVKAGLKRESIWTGRALSNVVTARVWEFPKDTGLPKVKTDALTRLFFASPLVALGKITKACGRDPNTDGLRYLVRLTKVLRGEPTEDTVQFCSGTGSHRAKYAEGEKLLLFLRPTRLKIGGKFAFMHQWPHVFLAQKRRPDAADDDIYLWPVEPYLKPFAFLAPPEHPIAQPATRPAAPARPTRSPDVPRERGDSGDRQKENFVKSGFTILDWEAAKAMLLKKAFTGGRQSHSGWVTLFARDGRRYATKQPKMDAIFTFIRKHNLTGTRFATE